MGSYHETQEALRRLGEVDRSKLRRDIERGIDLLDEATAQIENYLARHRINPTNHKRKPYEIQRGGRQ